MFDLIAEPVLSGIVGAVGGYFNKRLELKALDNQNKHDLAMLKAQTQANVTISQIDIEKLKVAGENAVKQGELKAFEKSQEGNSTVGSAIKAAIRPVLLAATGYLCYENMQAIELMLNKVDALNAEQLIALYQTVVVTLFSLFTMGTGWYFGQRTTKITDAFLNIIKR